jgi:hypothetical protein
MSAMRILVMQPNALRTLGLALIASVAVACGSGSSTNAPSAAPATFADYDAAFCGSFTSLIRAVGNPDAGTPSVLSAKLDAAVTARDTLAADQAAAAMTAELETGRRHAATGARWQPAATTMAEMDRLLVAFEAMTAAKRTLAARGPGAADPQQAFERAGGVEAWSAVLLGVGRMPVPSGTVPSPCRALSGQL